MIWTDRVRQCLADDDPSLDHALHRLMDRAEVPHPGWHQLRHTAATLLAAAGTDVATIGRILGHRPGSVVTLRYLHTDDERLRRAAEAVAEALQSACRTRRGSPRPTPRFSPLTRASRPT